MHLHEFQSKQRFAEFGIPVPQGQIATTPDEAHTIATQLGISVAIKAQVLTGGRGKLGGIKLANTPDEAQAYATNMLGTQIRGFTVNRILVEPTVDIEQELYLAIINDRAASCPVLIASCEGGMEISNIALANPDAIIREPIDPILGLRRYQITAVASGMNLAREYWDQFIDIALKLFECYVRSDAQVVEINPLAVTSAGGIIAIDGKISVDDNALFRQQELATLRDTSEEPETETMARLAGISYVKLDGQIGCIVNGAGLAMATMDMIQLYGGDRIRPANFLDIGGGARADKAATALRLILAKPSVNTVLVNIFGGVTHCDEIASGIKQVCESSGTSLPIIVRFNGNRAAQGRSIIDELPNAIHAASLTDAVQKAVRTAKEQV